MFGNPTILLTLELQQRTFTKYFSVFTLVTYQQQVIHQTLSLCSPWCGYFADCIHTCAVFYPNCYQVLGVLTLLSWNYGIIVTTSS